MTGIKIQTGYVLLMNGRKRYLDQSSVEKSWYRKRREKKVKKKKEEQEIWIEIRKTKKKKEKGLNLI